MSIEMKTKYGQIDISNEVIAMVAGGAAIDCYGIVGMASKTRLKTVCLKSSGERTSQKAYMSVRKPNKYISTCTLLSATALKYPK